MLVAGALVAHLAGAGAAIGVHRVMRGWLELEEAAAMLTAGLAIGCGAATVEALWRVGRRRLACLCGVGIGPAVVFGALFAGERALGSSTPRALADVGDLLATPQAPGAVALMALLCAAAVGALVHHRLRAAPPARVTAGAALALLASALAVAPPPLSERAYGHVLGRILTDLATVAAALTVIPLVQGPAERLVRWIGARLGLEEPPADGQPADEQPTDDQPTDEAGRLGAWAAARWTRLRDPLRVAAPPWDALRQRARAAFSDQEQLIGLLGPVLLLAAGLELGLQLALRAQPQLADGARTLFGLRGALAEAWALCFLRAVMLMLPAGLLALRGMRRSGEAPARSPLGAWALFAGAAGLELLLLGWGPARAGTLLFAACAALLLVGVGTRVFEWKLTLGLVGGYLGLASPSHALAQEIGLLPVLPLPGRPYTPGGALGWGLAGLALTLLAALRWGLPVGRVLGTAAGAAALSLLFGLSYLTHGLVGEGWGWSMPDELHAAVALAGLLGGGLAWLLARGFPRLGPLALLLAAGLAPAAILPPPPPPWEDLPTRALRARAQAGEAPAMRDLGARLLASRGGMSHEGSLEEAARWSRLAAEAGDPQAMHRWGCLLLEGRLVPRDRAAGRAWVERAAAAGCRGATERLAWEDERAAEADAQAR